MVTKLFHCNKCEKYFKKEDEYYKEYNDCSIKELEIHKLLTEIKIDGKGQIETGIGLTIILSMLTVSLSVIFTIITKIDELIKLSNGDLLKIAINLLVLITVVYVFIACAVAGSNAIQGYITFLSKLELKVINGLLEIKNKQLKENTFIVTVEEINLDSHEAQLNS